MTCQQTNMDQMMMPALCCTCLNSYFFSACFSRYPSIAVELQKKQVFRRSQRRRGLCSHLLVGSFSRRRGRCPAWMGCTSWPSQWMALCSERCICSKASIWAPASRDRTRSCTRGPTWVVCVFACVCFCFGACECVNVLVCERERE